MCRRWRLLLAVLVVLSPCVWASEDVEPSKLPMAVKKGIQNRFPKAKQVSATKDVVKKETVYSVELKDGVQEISVTITAAGTIEEFSKTIAVEKLPDAARKAVSSHFPNAKIETVHEVSSVTDGRESVDEYEVHLKTKDKIEVTVSPSGEIEAIVRVITADKLPEVVRKTLNKQFPAAKISEIKEVSSLTNRKEVVTEYDVTLKSKAKGEIEVELSPDGKLIEDN